MIALLLALLAARFTVPPQAPVFTAVPTCYRTVWNVGKYYRTCIPASLVDSMRKLSPLWRMKDGKYDYYINPGQTFPTYTHKPRTAPGYIDHRKP